MMFLCQYYLSVCFIIFSVNSGKLVICDTQLSVSFPIILIYCLVSVSSLIFLSDCESFQSDEQLEYYIQSTLKRPK